ncbi:MAG: hypothetical protein IK113_06875 [Bacteroidales bacterium]|nr:hypothetical protein [Bacteroidales bacterium]
MKTIKVPLVNFDTLDLDSVMELQAARFDVNTVNWPSEYPYAPVCAGRIARTEGSLVVDFRVSGLDLRAENKEDNGSQWEDSCVEFFVEDPDGSVYYNFEINALGKVLACSGPDRHNRTRRPAEEMEAIARFASVSKVDTPKEGLQNWRVCIIIPFELIGIDPENLPKKIRANFYKCGDKTAHPHYVSWAPIDTPQPDFHRPEFFGELRF